RSAWILAAKRIQGRRVLIQFERGNALQMRGGPKGPFTNIGDPISVQNQSTKTTERRRFGQRDGGRVADLVPAQIQIAQSGQVRRADQELNPQVAKFVVSQIE